jgi:hypothetical protein
VSYSNSIVGYLSSKKPISITYRGSSRSRNTYLLRIRIVEARKYKGIDIRVDVYRFISIRIYMYIGIRD